MLDNLQQFTETIIKEHKLPATSVAVWKDGTLYQGAAGILNLDTQVSATTDSIFQIGSITKVFTAALIMKLVEMGRVDLDAPVKRYLRGFELADRKAAETITIKQLLNHTNGIAGDYFADDEKEDGPHIARFIDRCSQLPLVHPVGDGFSYSNVAFAVAGRVIEVVSGMSWFDAMEEMIYEPLGMKQAICRPADVIRFRAALGHLADTQTDALRTCSGKYLCMGQSPAGTTPTMAAAELITFGRAHLDKGVSATGQRWLSERSIELMQTATADIPSPSHASTSAMGLGWMLGRHKASGLRFVSHSGGTNGQCAHLRLFPEHNACFAVLLNRSKLDALTAMINQLTEATTGVKLDTGASVAAADVDHAALERYVGHYQSYAGDYRISLSDTGLVGTFDDAVDEEDRSTFSYVPHQDGCFEQRNADNVPAGLVYFSQPDDQQRPQRFFAGARLYQRVGN